MKRIYKYNLSTGQNVLEMPLGGEFLSASFQGGQLVAWFLVEVDNINSLGDFYVAITGEHVTNGMVYHSTAMTSDESFVVHIFSGLNI